MNSGTRFIRSWRFCQLREWRKSASFSSIDLLFIINLGIPGRAVMPDQMKVPGRIRLDRGTLGPARGPGEPLACRPAGPAVRALSVIDLKVSRDVILPYDMDIGVGIGGD